MRLMRHRSIKNGLRDVTGRDVIGRARLKLVLNLKSLLIINYNYIYNFSIQNANVHVYCLQQCKYSVHCGPRCCCFSMHNVV